MGQIIYLNNHRRGTGSKPIPPPKMSQAQPANMPPLPTKARSYLVGLRAQCPALAPLIDMVYAEKNRVADREKILTEMTKMVEYYANINSAPQNLKNSYLDARKTYKMFLNVKTAGLDMKFSKSAASMLTDISMASWMHLAATAV